ncbi:MAG: sugar ABC transporter permease [Elusimicrobia bacterium CG08_land_8_20_14_0_20_59_10]|nr:MAG: sugar ABC transporter permease [Elusimicrobia bacterium CG08_land_8_20_14_0_20_59_10]
MTILEHFKKGFKENIRQYTMLLALAAIWVIMSSLTDGVFISPRNISNLFLQTVTVAIVALGMTLVIVTGNIDLSVGSVAGFTGAVAAVLQVKYGWSTPAALAAAAGAGLAIGAWHGFWVAYRKVPAFIVTLASMLAFRGAILGVTGGSTVSPLHASFKAIGTEYLSPYASALLAAAAVVAFVLWSLHNRRQRLEYGFPVAPARVEGAGITAQAAVIAAVFAIMVFNQGVPYSVLLLLGLALVFSFMAEDTVFGRRLYAIGGNPEAARLSGINIEKNGMYLFMIFGVLTAIAGCVMTARLNAATTSAGVNMELDAIAACVIGGTSLMGGEGTIVGALVGALIMSSLDNGMSLMNLDITYQYVVKGLILLLAVWVDIANRRK